MSVTHLEQIAAPDVPPAGAGGTGARVVRLAASGLFVILVLATMVVGVGAMLGYRLSPVLSGSMRPAFSPGAAVVLRPVPVSTVRPGMIVEFVPPGQSAPYTHRVISVTGSPSRPLIRTKGDANPAPDPWQVQLNGPDVNEVVGSVPYLGRAMLFAHQPGALLALIGLVVTGGGLATTISLYRREYRGSIARMNVPL